MTKVIVSGFSLSFDGYGAGPDQSLEDPLGKRGEELHTWMIGTAMFHEMLGKDGGSEGIDNDYAIRSMEGFGAFIMGRNMFGPVRRDWPDDTWKGWWGDNPLITPRLSCSPTIRAIPSKWRAAPCFTSSPTG